MGDEVGVVDVLGSRAQPMLKVRPRTRMRASAQVSTLFINFILTYQMLRNN
jgi:rRNA processing protein Gar1